MIYLDSWQIKPSAEVNSFTSGIDYEAVYVGTELTLDDRVAWIDNYLDGNLPHKVVVRYDAESSQLHFSDSNSAIPIGELQNLHTPRGRILFEATSLLLPELLYLMEWANLAKKDFDVIYVEPSAYTQTKYKAKIGSQSIDYSLSEDGPGLSMLPRFISPIEDGHLVVALGYEGHRFGALLISDEITSKSMTAVLGVPPFVLGWEKNTFAKNHHEMADARKRYEAEFKAVAANDPLQNYSTLTTIQKSVAALDRHNRSRVLLAPIGTKPVALAMAWFAINNKGTGILYDFIRKKSKRSTGIGKVHLWQFSCS